MTLIEEICNSLYHTQYHFHNEKELQQGVAKVLSSLGLNFSPEYYLGKRDRIDFMLLDLGIGLECKSDDSSGGTSLSAVTRQLMRYSQSSEIKSLILLTSMSKHKNLPLTLNDKPIYVVHLLHSFL